MFRHRSVQENEVLDLYKEFAAHVIQQAVRHRLKFKYELRRYEQSLRGEGVSLDEEALGNEGVLPSERPSSVEDSVFGCDVEARHVANVDDLRIHVQDGAPGRLRNLSEYDRAEELQDSPRIL